jgi:NAD(P)H-hydrate epimerase
MKIVTADEMRAIDRATSERYGVSSLTLMENAGRAVADFMLREFPDAERIAVICGKGNNGGDGFVAARGLLEAGREVQVFLLAEARDVSGDAGAMLPKLPKPPQAITSEAVLAKIKLSDFDLIVDAILGTGFRPPGQPLYASAIRAINESDVPVLSVDIPSGAESDAESPDAKAEVVKADAIVTFTALKPAHVFQFASIRTEVRQIGTPPGAVTSERRLNLITPADFRKLLRPRDAASNKGMFGHVLVVGGSRGKAGAPAMCGMAVLRSGAGLVTVAAPKSAQPIVASFAPELMTEALPESATGAFSLAAGEELAALTKGKTVLAIGPGASRDDEAAKLIRNWVDQTTLPLILDADGLNAFEGHAQTLNKGRAQKLILTPHPGEMSRLTGLSVKEIQGDRIGTAKKFASEHALWLVLKGYRTVVVEPGGEVWINTTGNPGMATGGTGDILTGIIAGLIAQHPQDISTAVIAAVYLHGLAADIARDEMGEISMTATDLLLALPVAFQRVAANAEEDSEQQ